MDLREAFDSVPNDLFLTKIERYGITGKPLRWIGSYLIQWTQFVLIGIANSD